MIKAVADNTVLSNFTLIEREGLLRSVFGDTLATTEAVMAW